MEKHEITGILHATMLVADTQKSMDFYQGILGLKTAPGRHLSFPGAWLETGNGEIHLMQLHNPDPATGRHENPGRDRHTALAVKNLSALEKKLADAGHPYNRSSSGRNALFTRDPDGNGLEFIEV